VRFWMRFCRVGRRGAARGGAARCGGSLGCSLWSEARGEQEHQRTRYNTRRSPMGLQCGAHQCACNALHHRRTCLSPPTDANWPLSLETEASRTCWRWRNGGMAERRFKAASSHIDRDQSWLLLCRSGSAPAQLLCRIKWSDDLFCCRCCLSESNAWHDQCVARPMHGATNAWRAQCVADPPPPSPRSRAQSRP